MSSKLSTFICQNCGSETSQYFGKCLNCNSWNSIVEEIKSKSSKYQEIKDIKNSKKSIPFNEISSKKYQDSRVVLRNLIEFLEEE
jgi:DNA repair protein RadA/Sms